MIKVGIITSSRAEYGLLKPVYLEFKKRKNINVKLIVTGTHISKKYGYTINEIKNDDISIDKCINNISNSKNDMSDIFSKTVLQFNKYFKYNNFDTIVILGDRYEILGIAIACIFNSIPICHINGGEATLGAIDEAIRHSISKMSYLHFTSCDEYRKRVIQLGESPNRVYNVGSLGVENVTKEKLFSKSELCKLLNINLDKYLVVTYHPETLKNNVIKDFRELLNSLTKFNDYQVIFTKSNADKGGLTINKMIDDYVKNHKNAYSFFSLGVKKYLSLVKHSTVVIGNSSSGVIEVPALCIPTVNIGDRQKGRIRVNSIIDCKCNSKNIISAIKKAMRISGMINLKDYKLYKKGTSKNIVKIISNVFNKRISLMKKFYDIKV